MTPGGALASSPMATTMPGMSRDARGSLVRSAARGAGLVGAAVILGIILLQVVDDGGGTGGGGGNGNGTTLDTGADATTTTAATGDTRPPNEVVVQVLNAGGASGAAGTLSNALVTAGYTTLPAADDPVQRAGTAVACKEGFDADAGALLITVTANGYEGAAIEPFPAGRTDLPTLEQANCVVLIGS
jgi:hypothetical protein